MFFFFSSRRRHTRWTGDWSSDVCSSDLGAGSAPRDRGRRWPARGPRGGSRPVRRSEERRVGKECRSRWSPYHSKKKQNERLYCLHKFLEEAGLRVTLHRQGLSSETLSGDRIDFFFSSRRRHTRWTGDWSSDVCSSDLPVRRTLIVTNDFPPRQGGIQSFVYGLTVRLP